MGSIGSGAPGSCCIAWFSFWAGLLLTSCCLASARCFCNSLFPGSRAVAFSYVRTASSTRPCAIWAWASLWYALVYLCVCALLNFKGRMQLRRRRARHADHKRGIVVRQRCATNKLTRRCRRWQLLHPLRRVRNSFAPSASQRGWSTKCATVAAPHAP